MKIKNPNYKSNREQRLVFLDAQIKSFIASLPASNEFIEFETIKTMVAGLNLKDADGVLITESDLSDGILSEIATRNNIEIVE